MNSHDEPARPSEERAFASEGMVPVPGTDGRLLVPAPMEPETWAQAALQHHEELAARTEEESQAALKLYAESRSPLSTVAPTVVRVDR